MTLRYVTTNPGKVREAREYLDDVAALDYDYTEIQAPDLETVAAHGAREAFRHAGEPVIVDDAGLFVEALDGFPGPYSSYVEDTLGVELTGQVAREAASGDDPDRSDADGSDVDGNDVGGPVARASFRCVIGYCDGDDFAATPDPVDRGERRGQDLAAADRDTATTDDQVAGGDVPVKLFTGAVPGRIVEPRGDGGFGFDPIFEHDGTTFAEMDTGEKNAVSHRGRALATFADWFVER